MTATTGRTVLAIVAILSLLLSAFAIARPVIASHEPPDGPEVIPTAEEFGGGNPVCPTGSVGYRFNDPEADDSADVLLADGSTATVTILSVVGDALTFEVEGGLAAIVTVKGGVSSPGTPDQNVYDYTGFPGGGIAHDDGLTTPNEQGISHVDFCLIPVEASILVHKTDQTQANVAGAEFTVYDGDAVVGGPTATDADGLACFDGLVLDKDYTVVETDVPDGYIGAENQTVAASLGNCEARIAAEDAVDATFTNTLLGSLLVLKTDEADDPLEGAEFSITGPAEFADTATSDADGWFCLDGLTYGAEYTVTETAAPDGYQMDANNPQTHVIDDSATCAERVADSPAADLVFVNIEDEQPDGSVTVVKDLGDCEICETATPGRWFNQSPGTDGTPGTTFANASLGADPITVAGIEFASVADVHEHAKPGSLLWHYLGLQLNVRWGMDAECDLAGLVYAGADSDFHGWTVGQILAEAETVLNGGASDYSEQQLHDVVAEINESDTGDGTLVCPAEGGEGTVGVGYEFELWLAADYDEGTALDSGTTGADGSLTFSGLDLDVEYLLVEVGGPNPDETCRVVSATGTGVSFDAVSGTITFTLTENLLDLTISVTNECEEEEEEEYDVDLLKVDQDDNALAGVAFELVGDGYFATDTTDGDGAIYFDGILAGEYVLTETTSAPGCESAGPWTLTVGADGSFTFDPELATTEGGAFVIVNVCEDGVGMVEIDKLFCFTDDEASTEFFVFGPIEFPQVNAMGQVEEELPEEGCWTEAVSFTITGGALTEPLEVTTDDDGILEFTLPASESAYTITEDLSGESTEFFVADGEFTAIVVLNLVPEEEAGLVKVIKLFCEGDAAGVEFIVEGNTNADVPVISGCEVGDATFELGDMEVVTEGGIALVLVDAGDYAFAEIDPNVAEHDELVTVVEGEITTIIVINTFVEGEQGGNPTPGGGGEGTAGGNPLPNTATAPIPGSVPAALLALVMLTGLGAAGYAMQAEARRRR